MKIFGWSSGNGNEVRFDKPMGLWNDIRLLGAVILSCVLAVSCSTLGGMSTAGGDKAAGRPRALKEVTVYVELEKPPGDFQGINRAQIQNDVEIKLRQAGIKVAPQTRTFYSSGLPIIYVNVSIAKCEAMFAYNADIVCITTPARQPSQKPGQGTLGTSGLVPDIAQVRPKVADLVNQFIKNYLSV